MPATVLITEPFQGIVASHAARLGAPGYHALVVPHPIWSKDEAGLEALARQVVGRRRGAADRRLSPGLDTNRTTVWRRADVSS